RGVAAQYAEFFLDKRQGNDDAPHADATDCPENDADAHAQPGIGTVNIGLAGRSRREETHLASRNLLFPAARSLTCSDRFDQRQNGRKGRIEECQAASFASSVIGTASARDTGQPSFAFLAIS